MPAGESPHKRIDPEPGAEVRLEMTRLAAATDGLLEASDVETGREGPSFTFRTLELLTDARPTDELVFLMGADVAAGLEGWREPRAGARAGAAGDRRARRDRGARRPRRRWSASAAATERRS